ncbi:hypothetical protein HMPREF3166_01490 [Corynebacterium sp. HMSC08A12]|nr:hypothetical protein HMPREF3166_01490 [Corynebacterium sp. HMSC08A12]
MATIDDLKRINSAPRTVEEWLGRFNEEDRQVVVEAIISGKTSDLYPLLNTLETNPFTFRKSTINHIRRLLLERQ